MTNTPAPADVKWVIGFIGSEQRAEVEAATVENTRSAGSFRSDSDEILTHLLDATGNIVFQAPARLIYLHRAP